MTNYKEQLEQLQELQDSIEDLLAQREALIEELQAIIKQGEGNSMATTVNELETELESVIELLGLLSDEYMNRKDSMEAGDGWSYNGLDKRDFYQ